VLSTGCDSGPDAASGPAASEQPVPVIEVRVQEVEPQVWPLIVRTQGSLVPDEVVVLGTRVAGRVSEVHVDLGDVVSAGDPVMTLDQADFQLQIDQAEAELTAARSAVGLKPDDPLDKLDPRNSPPVRQEKAIWDEARSNHERARQLVLQNAISESEIRQIAAAESVAEARYAAALNSVNEKIALISVRAVELSLARQQISDSVVRAAFDGQVESRHVAPGTFVQIGDSVVTMVRNRPLRFRGSLPERHAHQLKAGQDIVLQIESIPEPRKAQVTRISPALDELSRALTFEARVDNQDGQLRAGLFAQAAIVIDASARAIAVPKTAVTEFAGVEKVWTVVDGMAHEVVVQTGQRRGDSVEVLGGLNSGDVILSNGSRGRIARVRPLQEASEAVTQSRSESPAGSRGTAAEPAAE